MWATLFSINSIIAMIAWLLLAFAPRKPLTHSAILFLGVGLLCLVYAVSMAAAVLGAIPGALSPDASGSTIAGVRAFFSTDAGVVIGWTHYLAFDLFTGMWIARDADAKGFSRPVQLPFLVFTFLLGPIGLLGWLVVRERRARATGRG